jgi:predicted RNase H-like nuclease (RuvC/YqgF family)
MAHAEFLLVDFSPVDEATLAQLRNENAVLGRELGAVQRRTTRLVAQQARTIEQLRAQLMRLRAELIRRDTTIAALSEALCERRRPQPTLIK